MIQPRIDNHPLLLAQRLQRIMQLAQGHDPPLDMLPLIQMLRRLRVPLLQLHLDRHHLHVRVRQARIRHDRRADVDDRARVAGLLAQLPHGRLRRRLALVDQPGGELDARRLHRRPVLQHEQRRRRPGGVAEDGRDGDGVDAAGFARLARRGLPDAVFAGLVRPVDFVELGPFRFRGG